MSPREDLTGRREAIARLLRAGTMGAGTSALAFWLAHRSRYPEEPAAPPLQRDLASKPDPALPEIVIARGDDPFQLVRRALDALGGVQRFVQPGDVVVLKPNVSWDRIPEQAATTNPGVVEETARLCFQAGAKRVVVADVCINEARLCYERSGVGAAARRAGAEVVLPAEALLRQVDLRGEALRVWPVFVPFLEADKVINLPIAKHHGLTGVTLGLKSWYGILGGTRQRLHQRINESLADLAGFMRPTLTIIDAYRVLLRGGPSGGVLSNVELKKTLLAGTDQVALDAMAAKMFWDLDAVQLPFLQLAARRGLGTLSFDKLRTLSL
jgi:uncharacterized protein (DUF362 family)